MCHGLKEEIAPVGSCCGCMLLLLNIFFPGFGTMINSCLGHHCSGTTFLVGIAQLLLTPLLIGWIWSIWWGCLMTNSEHHHVEEHHHHHHHGGHH